MAHAPEDGPTTSIAVDFIAGVRLATVDVPAAAEGAWTLSTATPVP